ncbi:sulfurtransferase [Pararobbsia silviterrae]|uniref:Sulfurtransferase n=1 Tax=Pararobbsia silviterrae TaxID=1792498 RepID=A0A494Y163_9BURK|nr:sulfurtransferase [Pararobbsia silviterrae]RKP56514.1 sulfurtransferase [Pararobbsia silviterrae]
MSHSHFTTLISASNLAERLAAAPDSVYLADCRFDLADTAAGERAFAAGHLPGARYFHLDTDLSGPKSGKNGRHPLPDRHALARHFGDRGMTNDVQIVAYDAHGGMYAARLWWLLRWLGHDSAAVLDGGLDAWTRAGLALSTDVPAETARAFSHRAPLAVTIDVTGIERNLSTHEHLVVDARAADRYRGENETIDRVGGHIPGARNRPFKDNLQSDGRFKPAHTLRDEFHDVLGTGSPERAVMQCGSGVTACHNLLAMEVAGLHGAALYGGSWSEWSAETTRPVATGPNP